MKKLLALITVTLAAATAMAQSFSSVSGTFNWAIGNEQNATVSSELIDAVLESDVAVGTDLTVSSSSTYKLDDVSYGPYCNYHPATSNPGYAEADMIEYTVKLRKGLTMQVSQVEFDAIKVGTDNAYFSWSYTMDGVAGDTVDYSSPKTQIRRDNNANPEVAITHTEAINAEAGRTFTLRFYISSVANNKSMSIGNIKISAVVSGDVIERKFKDFAIDFTPNPYTVTLPADGQLPEGVTVTGTWHDSQHGYSNAEATFTTDGPVRITIGGCNYTRTATVSKDGTVLATLDTQAAGCDGTVVYTYNSEEAATLVVNCGSYCPSLKVEACELLPMVDIIYYDTDGKSVIGTETVEGGTPLTYSYGAADVTIADGQAFRGWFNNAKSTAVKVAEGTSVQADLKLYARATDIEIPTTTSRFVYDLTKAYFYVEDHEAIEIDGKYYNNHGWLIDKGGSIRVQVAGKCYVTVTNCAYTATSEVTVTDAAGQQVAAIPVTYGDPDGTSTTIQYDGPATTLSFTYPSSGYVHGISVYNVVDFVSYDEAKGYYQIPAGDVSSFLLALVDANSHGNRQIFLPNGTYDLGVTTLTTVSGNNISIIGESMEGTIIRNAPPYDQEGIGVTATLLNTSDGLYMQDLTLQNALEYYKTGDAGRAVCLQDKGKNTICKNVRMLSYQDTYYSNAASNFYWEDSEIHGTVDYLCGDGNVVYNRVKLVNESRSESEASGSDVICAPYSTATTDARYNWGYVFLDCSISSANTKDFTFARSWGGESKAAFIRTTILDGSISSSRFTTAGMNVAASSFKEYQTRDAEGNITTPESNILNFTHSSGNKSYETVLTDEEAANYTLANIYGKWAPDQTAAQVVVDCDYINAEDNAADIVMLTTQDAAGLTQCQIGKKAVLASIDSINDLKEQNISGTLRAANSRGGFGPAFDLANYQIVGIENIEAAEPAATPLIYNICGQRMSQPQGFCIVNGHKTVR